MYHVSFFARSWTPLIGLILSSFLALGASTNAPSHAPSHAPSYAPSMAPTLHTSKTVFDLGHSDDFILVACLVIVVYSMVGLFFRWTKFSEERDAKIAKEQALAQSTASPNAPGNPLHRSRPSQANSK